MNLSLPNMTNQHHCRASFADISSRSGDTAIATDQSIGFVDENHSSTLSAITLETDLLPPSPPLHRLAFSPRYYEEQKGVERLMASFGEHRNETRFSGCSEGGLDKPVSSPERKLSMDHRKSCLDYQDVQPCRMPLRKRSLGHWKGYFELQEVHQPCSMPQRQPSLGHFNFHEECQQSNQGTFFLKEDMPFAPLDNMEHAQTAEDTDPMWSPNMREPRRKYGTTSTRRREKESDAGEFLGYSRTSESATSLELCDVFWT